MPKRHQERLSLMNLHYYPISHIALVLPKNECQAKCMHLNRLYREVSFKAQRAGSGYQVVGAYRDGTVPELAGPGAKRHMEEMRQMVQSTA